MIGKRTTRAFVPWRNPRGWPAVAVGAALALACVFSPVIVSRHQGCAEVSGKDKTLHVVLGKDISRGTQEVTLIHDWSWRDSEGNTYHAEPVELSAIADQQRSQMAASAQSGNCEYDVLSLDVPWIQEFVKGGYIQPIDSAQPSQPRGFNARDFLDAPWRAGTVDGAQYAIPFTSDAGLLYYRTDIAKTPPSTWAELNSQLRTPDAQAFLRTPGRAAYVGQYADYEGLTVNALEAIKGAGGHLPDGSAHVDIDARALHGIANMMQQMNSRVILPEAIQAQEAESITAFASGRVLYMRNWPYAYDTLDTYPAMRGNFNVAPLPTLSEQGSAEILGGHSLSITKNTRYPEAARELIRELTNLESQQQIFICGGFAPTRTLAYTKINVTCNNSRENESEIRSTPSYAPILLKAVKSASPRPFTPYYPQFSQALRRWFRQNLIDSLARPPGSVRQPDHQALETDLENALRGR